MEKLTDREVREKLVSRGVQSLSDRELLSIILGEGSAGYSAVETAGRILDAYDGSLPAMARADMTRLRMTEGIGVKRAAVLTAVFELAGRLHRQEAAAPASIRTKDDVTALFAPLLARLPHEEMWALYLSSANGVIEKMRVSHGPGSGLQTHRETRGGGTRLLPHHRPQPPFGRGRTESRRHIHHQTHRRRGSTLRYRPR